LIVGNSTVVSGVDDDSAVVADQQGCGVVGGDVMRAQPDGDQAMGTPVPPASSTSSAVSDTDPPYGESPLEVLRPVT
jgi:hypothetical protein